MPLPAEGLRLAAVLALIDPSSDGLPVLLQTRSRRLHSHPGQIALPGGGAAPGETPPWRTALREASEELAVPDASVEPLGYLDPVGIRHSRYLVVPTVALLREPFTPSPSPDEVSGWFWMPLRYTPGLVEETHRRRRTGLGTASVPGYLFESHFVWGAARVIIDDLRRRLGEPLPSWGRNPPRP